MHVPMGEPAACETILASIESVEKLGKRCVAHCTHGMGRSGRVAAAWLCRRYELKAAEATHEAMVFAETKNLVRLGNPMKLEIWLKGMRDVRNTNTQQTLT